MIEILPLEKILEKVGWRPCECFWMPPDEAVHIGVLGTAYPKPAWVCFLTTEEHVQESFATRLREVRQNHASWVDSSVPVAVRALSSLACVVYSLGNEVLVYPRYREIDVALMHLQRSETVSEALITSVMHGTPQYPGEMRFLHDEYDATWKKLWGARPLD